MQMTYASRTQNENLLIQYKNSLFSENIYAWFDYGMIPVFSNKLEDLMLPEDYVLQHHSENRYEVFAWNQNAGEHIYTGALFAPKGIKLA
jgi:hypothetical protein